MSAVNKSIVTNFKSYPNNENFKQMKPIIPLLLLTFTMSCSQQEKFEYPFTKKGEVVDEYFGTKVEDPYRWLEDDMSDETAQWVKAQNELTYSYLKNIPFLIDLKDRLTEIWDYPRMGIPNKEQDLYFYSFNTGLQNQSIIYVKKNLEDEGEVFLDPNAFSEDGTVSLSAFSVSGDGKYVGYGISRAGSDWQEYFVRETETRKDLADHLKWIKHSGLSWYKDGFFYNRFEKPNEGDELKGENKNSRVFYHKVGTDQSEDMLIYKDEAHPDWSFGAGVTEDEKYMFLAVSESTSGNALAYRKAGIDDSPFIWLEKEFENDFSPIGSMDNILYLRTNLDAPNYKLVAIDLTDPDRKNWVDLIPEDEKNVLEACTLAGGKILASYLKDAYNIAKVFELNGDYLHELELPGIGSLSGFRSKMKENIAFYSFTSFNYPSVIFKYDIAKNKSEPFYETEVDFDGNDYETKQVFYSSKDGTKVPMFIVCKKGTKFDGNNPTWLYGYGGFNITYSPSFNASRAVWMEQGGVFALANIRGGGEYGEEWHKAGTVLNKQNVFDDFIAAAEFLIDKGYTSSERLAIQGGSNGGLLVGAVVNQRPDLFAVAIPAVGVMDMLRFHKFTIGRYWTVDYGSSEDSVQFEYLYKYSPLHNISEDKSYPAVLVLTGDHDDRVVPAHSFKYIASLQEKYKGENPVMVRIETDAGHGGGKPMQKYIEESTDYMAFMFYNLDFEPSFK